MTLGSLFDGSGGFPLAAELNGINPIWASEIEPFPIRVTTKRFPNMRHLGDITKIKGSEIEPTDIITFGSPCFPEGTLILTESGYLPIEKIKIGTKVLTHKGRWREVTDFGMSKNNTLILSDGDNVLECTPNHKIYVGDDKWCEAHEMLEKNWASPITIEPLKNSTCPYKFSAKLFYIIGKWLSNGWTDENLCIRSQKDPMLENALMYVTNGYARKAAGISYIYKIKDINLNKWVKQEFIQDEKKIPSWVYSLNNKYKESLLKGLGNRFENKELIYGSKLLYETLDINVKAIKFFKFYRLKNSKNKSKKDDIHLWKKVKKKKILKKEKTVYNITVDEDHSYIADGIVVKNCQDLSVAGKREGIEGSRSSLFFEATRIIKEMRKETNGKYPRYAVWENVPGAFSSNNGEDFKCVLETLCNINEKTEISIPMPQKQKRTREGTVFENDRWADAGNIVGDDYSIAWRVLDAEYWGVPQRRKRIFLIADLAGDSAGKILFESNGMSRNTAQSNLPWQRIATNTEKGTRRTGECIENTPKTINTDQDGNDIGEEKNSKSGKYMTFMQNQRNEVRDLKGRSGALCANAGMKQQTYILQGNMIGRKEENGSQGNGINEGVCFTLNATDKHAVVYNASKASFFTRINEDVTDPLVATDWKEPQMIGKTVSGKDVYGTLMANMGERRCLGNQEAFSGNYHIIDSEYAVRRLTPLECCRLQGFPDFWCDGLEIENPTEEEIEFWQNIFETHRLATDPKKKPKTKSQVIKWLKEPYSDTAAYKMWGNGVALPCVYFILNSIKNYQTSL